MPKKKPVRKTSKKKAKPAKKNKPAKKAPHKKAASTKKRAVSRKPAPKKKAAKVASKAPGVASVEVFEVEVVGGVEPHGADEVEIVDEEASEDDFPPDTGGSE